MTDNTDGLILHLPLTEPLDNRTIDRSPARNELQIIGTPQLTGDRRLGAAHRFAEKDSVQIPALKLPNAPMQFTLQVWIRPEGDTGQQNVLTIGGSEGGSLSWQIESGSMLQIWRAWPGAGSGEGGNIVQEPQFSPGKWSHLTLQFDGTTLSTWIDGIKVDNANLSGFSLDKPSLTLAGLGSNDWGQFIGSMAHVRGYSRVLSQEEIETSFHADLSLRAAYIEGHPIRLSLLGENEHPVIYMSNHTEGEPLTLALFNLAGRPLYLDPLTGEPSSGNHHFELRFRPGTLHPSAIAVETDPKKAKTHLQLVDKTDTAEWKMSKPSINSNGTISFFLIHKTKPNASFMLASEQTARIHLTNVRANLAGGARNGRVELGYDNLHMERRTNGQTNGLLPKLLHGTSISHFSILSHIGRKHLPLHVCFIGGNTVIPGAKDNSLTLRLTNFDSNPDSDLPIPWKPGNSPYEEGVSYFEIGFDYALGDADRPWALCSLDDSKNIDVADENVPEGTHQTNSPQPMNLGLVGNIVTLPDISWEDAKPDDEVPKLIHQPNADGEWLALVKRDDAAGTTVRIYSPDAVHLGADKHIEITLNNIVTTLPNGSTNLYLRYRNIPGYQAGEIVMTVEKSPLVVRGDKIGIGTPNPRALLHISVPGDKGESNFEDLVFGGRGDEALIVSDSKDMNQESILRPSGLVVHNNEQFTEMNADEFRVDDLDIAGLGEAIRSWLTRSGMGTGERNVSVIIKPDELAFHRVNTAESSKLNEKGLIVTDRESKIEGHFGPAGTSTKDLF